MIYKYLFTENGSDSSNYNDAEAVERTPNQNIHGIVDSG